MPLVGRRGRVLGPGVEHVRERRAGQDLDDTADRRARRQVAPGDRPAARPRGSGRGARRRPSGRTARPVRGRCARPAPSAGPRRRWVRGRRPGSAGPGRRGRRGCFRCRRVRSTGERACTAPASISALPGQRRYSASRPTPAAFATASRVKPDQPDRAVHVERRRRRPCPPAPRSRGRPRRDRVDAVTSRVCPHHRFTDKLLSDYGPRVTSDLFRPARLGPVTLRNRIVKAATFEGMSPRGQVTDALIDFHRAYAAGGAGLTTVAYCAVSMEGRGAPNEIVLRRESRPGLERLAAAVHAEGAAVSAQIGHAGPVAQRYATQAEGALRVVGVEPARHALQCRRPRRHRAADRRLRRRRARARRRRLRRGRDPHGPPLPDQQLHEPEVEPPQGQLGWQRREPGPVPAPGRAGRARRGRGPASR